MATIELGYGRTSITFEYEDARFDVLAPNEAKARPLSDNEVTAALDDDAYDPSQLIQIGSVEDGAPIEVNRALKEFSKVIITGAVGFHYFAGFTGGRKSICPGLASARTIEATHMLALDFEHG